MDIKSSSDSCVFCKIIAQEIPAKIIAQNDNVIVIQDRAPKAPIHYLLLPKKHISDIRSLQEVDASLVGDLFLMAQKVSENFPGSKSFRLLVNNGADVGQTVFHLHIHMLSGKKMSDF